MALHRCVLTTQRCPGRPRRGPRRRHGTTACIQRHQDSVFNPQTFSYPGYDCNIDCVCVELLRLMIGMSGVLVRLMGMLLLVKRGLAQRLGGFYSPVERAATRVHRNLYWYVHGLSRSCGVVGMLHAKPLLCGLCHDMLIHKGPAGLQRACLCTKGSCLLTYRMASTATRT